MKSTRRHDLQTNVLADWLGAKINWAQSNATWLLGGLLVVIAVFVVFSIRESRLSSVATEGWSRFDAASAGGFAAVARAEHMALNNAVRNLEDLVREHQGTQLAAYAELTLGDLSLRSGQLKYRENKTAARESFQNAAQYYRSVSATSSSSEIRNRALYCLAKSLEWQMKLQQAREVYLQVEGAFALEAQGRARDLSRKGTKTFYEQFAQWKPKEKPAPVDGRYPELDFKLQEQSAPDSKQDETALEKTIDGAGLEDSSGAASSGAEAEPATEGGSGTEKEGDDAEEATKSKGDSDGQRSGDKPPADSP